MPSCYRKLGKGETVKLDLGTESLSIACCDCGAVHVVWFTHIEGDRWEIHFAVNKRAMGQLRRHCYGFLQQDGRLRFERWIGQED